MIYNKQWDSDGKQNLRLKRGTCTESGRTTDRIQNIGYFNSDSQPATGGAGKHETPCCPGRRLKIGAGEEGRIAVGLKKTTPIELWRRRSPSLSLPLSQFSCRSEFLTILSFRQSSGEDGEGWRRMEVWSLDPTIATSSSLFASKAITGSVYLSLSRYKITPIFFSFSILFRFCVCWKLNISYLDLIWLENLNFSFSFLLLWWLMLLHCDWAQFLENRIAF